MKCLSTFEFLQHIGTGHLLKEREMLYLCLREQSWQEFIEQYLQFCKIVHFIVFHNVVARKRKFHVHNCTFQHKLWDSFGCVHDQWVGGLSVRLKGDPNWSLCCISKLGDVLPVFLTQLRVTVPWLVSAPLLSFFIVLYQQLAGRLVLRVELTEAEIYR